MSRVIIRRAYENSDLDDILDSSLLTLVNEEALRRARRIVMKPNLCALMSPETGATTDPRIAESLVRILRKRCVDAEITIVESDSFERGAEEAFDRLGYTDLADEYEVKLTNLSNDEKLLIALPEGSFLKKLELPLTLMDCDFFISVAKLKTHLFERYSGVLKNQFGCVPRRLKSGFHPFLSQVISDINYVITPDLSIIDGITAMEGKGPTWSGKPRQMNVLLLSNDPVAVDAIGARIIGIDPASVPHLAYSHRRGIGAMNGIEVLGENPGDFAASFESAEWYAYYSHRFGSLLKRVGRRCAQWGEWMTGMRWRNSRLLSLLPRRLKRALTGKT